MAYVYTIDGAPGLGRRGGGKIEPGSCACFTNPRTGRKTKICKDQHGKTRIKGRC